MAILFSTPTCIAETTVFGADKIFLSVVFFSLALVTFLALRRDISTKSKIVLIYSHLTFLLFPFILLTTNTTCGLFCMQCHNNYPALVSYALPGTIAASTFAGLFVIPAFYTMSGKRNVRNKLVRDFVARYSKTMNIRTPNVYLVDKAKPVAFSFRSVKSSIFLSVGAMDVLTKKELQAVLLHELAHIKHRSSQIKFSSFMMRFSPFSLLAGFHDSGTEERLADGFAAGVQKTDRHLKNAKKKFEAFE